MESLLHAREISCQTPVRSMVRELDRSMQCSPSGSFRRHCSDELSGKQHFGITEKRHWSDEMCGEQDSGISERRNRDLEGHLIEFSLTDYVVESLAANPALLHAKGGRPYLDYALRYDANVAFRQCTDITLSWSTLSADPLMVDALLNFGCDMNEKVQIYGSRTVWELYLDFLYENELQIKRCSEVTWLPINRGAAPIKRRTVSNRAYDFYDKDLKMTLLSMDRNLTGTFGEDEARAMCDAIEKNRRARRWWFWPFK